MIGHIKARKHLVRHNNPGLVRWGTIVFGFSVSCVGLSSLFLGEACAQSPLASGNISEAEQSPRLRQPRFLDTSILSPPPTAPLPEEPLLRFGPVNLRPHFQYRFLHGDGIPAQANDKSTTSINEVHPGILFDVGRHWRLDYTPSLRYYTNRRFRDTLGQSVTLNGATTFRNWGFDLSQRYATTSQPMIETGAQTDQETYATSFDAQYAFNSKATLEMGFNQDFRFVGKNASSEQLVDTKEWSTLNWLNYQFWPKFGAAIGVGGGYLEFSSGSAMSFGQLQGRVNWLPTERLTLQLTGGFEDRQLLDDNTPDAISPLFGASITYKPFEVTSVSLNASRSVMSSYLFGQVTENTEISGGIRQRLFKQLHFDLNGGYRVSSYQASLFGWTLTREDDYAFVNARLSMSFLKRGTAGVFYQASDNTSTGFKFQRSSTQVGFDIGYRF